MLRLDLDKALPSQTSHRIKIVRTKRARMDGGSATATTIAVVGSEPKRSQFNRVPSSTLTQIDSNLVDLIELLEKIDGDSPLAKLNETTISDNNGGRINL